MARDRTCCSGTAIETDSRRVDIVRLGRKTALVGIGLLLLAVVWQAVKLAFLMSTLERR